MAMLNEMAGQLEVRHLRKSDQSGFSIQDISFIQPPMQQIAIAGETGSGKTSLLKMIGGLMQPDSGDVFYSGIRVKGPMEKLLPGHPKIAYLSQHFELRNNYRVEEELEAKNLMSNQAAERVYEICRISHLLKRRTDQLSGGERQRIVLARLLTTEPGLLLLDEPFSNLDREHTRIIKQVLSDLEAELKISCIMVSHDAEDLLSWAHRLLIIKDGKLIQDAAPEMVYTNPVDVYTAQLVGELNLLEESIAGLLFPEAVNNSQYKQWMIRPEQLQIVQEGEGQLSAIVKQVAYFGSHYLVQAIVNEHPLLIRSFTKHETGTTIGLRVETGAGKSF